jgi:dTDP-4-amino-4,6-dideoxygalactose transaminase
MPPTPIRLSRCLVGPEEENAAALAIRSAYLGMGSETAAFESELANFIGGKREVIAVNTGTSALHLALQSCGIGPGDEVLVPSLTFVASFQAVSATGARPIACDVRESDLCLDPEDAARRITSRTRAIMPVHYASSPGALDEIYTLAATHKLRVIEDAAHAFGCTRQGRMVGSTGDLVCFSFDGIKNITSCEGGAVVTADTAAAQRMKDARLLGVERDSEKRYTGQRSWDFDVAAQGWRYHMSNINAAIGRVQLRRFPVEFGPRRMAIAHRYTTELSGLTGLRLLPTDFSTVVPHIFPVRVSAEKRDAMRAALLAEGIETGIHYKPNHLLSKYLTTYTLPVSEQAYSELFTLPLHAGLAEDDLSRVTITIRNQLSN